MKIKQSSPHRFLSCAEYILIPFKFFLIFCLLVWIGFWVAYSIVPDSISVQKAFEMLDLILFWGVIVLLIMIALVLLVNYRQHLGYALLYPFLNHGNRKLTGYDVCIPRFYTSLMLWLMVYLIVLAVLAIIAKKTNRHSILLYAF